MSEALRNNKRRGRKGQSGNVRIVPVLREKPDIEKLGRAVIAMAMMDINPAKPGENHEEKPR